MNWKLLVEIDRVLFLIPAVVFLLGMFGFIGTERPAKVRADGRIEFGPGWMTPCFFAMLATWLPIAVAGYVRFHSKSGVVLPLAIGLAMLAFAFEFPGTIVVSNEGLVQHFWLRPDKRLRWGQIAEIRTTKKSGPVTIAGANGVKIIHSPHLVDRARLLREVKKQCAPELPPDFPREDAPGS